MAKLPKNSSGTGKLERSLPWMLIIGGGVGLVSSFVLTLERMHALENPTAGAICDLNPIFSCSSVGSSAQAEAFGIYNPLLGLAGYAAVVTIGAALLAGARFKRWFWVSINVGLLLASIFLHWLIFQTLYRIGALCLFCMFAWAATIPLAWYVFLYSLRKGYIRLPERLTTTGRFLQNHHGDILLAWFLLIIVLILKRFWYYWSTLI